MVATHSAGQVRYSHRRDRWIRRWTSGCKEKPIVNYVAVRPKWSTFPGMGEAVSNGIAMMSAGFTLV